MIEKIARLILKTSGQGKALPFLSGISQIGQPGKILFPKELLGQGSNILLSGLNNTLAFQSNPDWIWPRWYEEQCDAKSASFIPTGMNMVTTNITNRNWTSLGVPGSDQELMVDGYGMVTPGAGMWSLLPYMRMGNSLLVAGRVPAKQRWVGASAACIETLYPQQRSVHWSLNTTMVEWEEEELAIVSLEFENQGHSSMRCVAGFSLRPYNMLSVSHIHRIKFDDSLWRINRKPALWLMEQPDRIAIGDRKGIDPIYEAEHGNTTHKISSRSGIAAGACEWDLDLLPWSRERIVVVIPIRKKKESSFPWFRRPTYEVLVKAEERIKNQSSSYAKAFARLYIPEQKWAAAWNLLVNRLHVFDDGDRFSPGTFLYHELWIRDSSYIAMLFSELGASHYVVPKLKRFLSLQQRDGFFCSQSGEWDSNGQAISSIVHDVICSGNRNLLEECYPAIRAGAEWIGRQCASTLLSNSKHKGLLPAGFSAEHFGPNDHYFWDNFWSLKGLEDAKWAASVMNDKSAEDWIHAYALRLRESLGKNMQEALSRTNGRGLPSSPYRKVDSASVGTLVAISPLNLWSASESWVGQTLQTLWEENVQDGMFFQKIVHTGLNAYLSVQLARGFLARNDSRWMTIMQGVLEHASNTYTWPEAIHPRTGGGCMGDGDHGWAVAEVLAFWNSVMVRIQDGVLLLGHGVPREWYRDGAVVGAERIHTRAGIISWSVQCIGNRGTLQWTIERNLLQKRIAASFLLPASLGLSHPRLSSFSQGQSELLLQTDTGTMEIPLGDRGDT